MLTSCTIVDVHFPHLTVEQTLKFAVASRTPRVRVNGISRKDYEDYLFELLVTVFGLTHTSQTKVGNDYVRGISGGQRKRVSIAEALAARASVYCWDNSTRGLDSSTALEYTQAIRASTNFLGNVGIVAIYQAGENIYEVFDKVTILYGGRQVYFGPTENAKKYFEEMGWECPSRQSTPEFLTAVTDPAGRSARPGFEHKVPRTALEFEQYWHNSPEFQAVLTEIDAYENANQRDTTLDRFHKASTVVDKMKRQRANSRYMLTFPAQIILGVKRGMQRVMGDSSYAVINFCSPIFQAFVVASMFWKSSSTTSGAYSRGGALFFTVLLNVLAGLAEVNNSFAHRPILMKQKSYSFYHPAVESLQRQITDLPVKIIIYICFAVVTYFLANLNQTAGQFFFLLLIFSLTAFCTSALFQTIAAYCKDSSTANGISGLLLLIFILYSGYFIPLQTMHPWFKWISYLNPIRYGFEALMANEFHGREMVCDAFVPSGLGYENITLLNKVCMASGSKAGSATVIGDDYISIAYSYFWKNAWDNFGILVGFWIGLTVLCAIGTEFLQPMTGGGDVLLFKRGHLPENVEETEIPTSEELTAQLSNINGQNEPDIFSWQHVNFTVPVKGGTRKLLDDVQGFIKPGTMTALMGESGAGKTTLLNVLSQRINIGIITGDMFVNGRSVDESFQRRTGYVQQQDMHLAESTVRESLQFAARLRQHSATPDAEKMAYVEKIIDLLGMTNYSEAYVGAPGKGLNVEQRKKLSIGVELVAKPSLLLFLDEPTSGLDSQSAWSIISLMKSVAGAGQSILCTIHQPSATLFEQFDRLLLLKRGGRTVYFGDIGKSSEILTSYFQRNGSRACEPAENPAEYILDCIGSGATNNTEDWGDIWLNSVECANTTEEIEDLHVELRNRPTLEVTKAMKAKFATSYLTQLKLVYVRTMLQFWRSPVYIVNKFLLMIIGALMAGFSFWDIDHSLAGAQNAMFGVFLCILISAPLCIQILTFAEQSRDLYEVREAASNTFHWSTLLLGQWFSEIPYHLVFSTMYFCCFYFPIRYSTTASVAGYFYLIYCVMFQLYMTSFGLMMMYASPNSASAAVIISIAYTLLLSFAGVTQPVSLMPGFWTFLWKVSSHTYYVQSLLGIVLNERPVVCASDEYNYFNPPDGKNCGDFMKPYISNNGGYVKNPFDTSNCGYCKYTTGTDFLKTIDSAGSIKWRNFGFFFIYIIFNLVAMLALYYLLRVRVWQPPTWFNKLKEYLFHEKIEKVDEPAPPNLYILQPQDEAIAAEVDHQIEEHNFIIQVEGARQTKLHL